MPFDASAVKDLWQCPQSKSPLIMHGERVICVGPKCRLGFDIRDNIPVLLVDEATPIDKSDWSSIMEENGRSPETGELVQTTESETGD